MTKRFVPGQRVKSLPGSTLNRAIDAADRLQEALPPGGPQPGPRPTDIPRLVVLVRNDAGVDLLERAIVGVKSTTLALPEITLGEHGNRANANVLMGEAVDVELPDAAKHTAGRWGVTLAPIKQGKTGYIAIAGLIKVRIDQLDETHRCVVVKTGETEYVESSASGTPVTWRKRAGETGEDAEGMQWGQVNLGAGAASGSTLRYAEVTVEISAESGGTVGSGEVQPKKNDGGSLVNDGDPVAVVNLHPLTFEVGWRGYIDAGKTPPEAVVFTCAPE